MSQADDIDAINAFMLRQTPVTTNQRYLIDSWKQWYDGLSWISKNTNSSVLEEARSRRDAYNNERAPSSQVITTTGVPNVALVAIPPGPKPTLKEGVHKATPSAIPYVKVWQRIVGTSDDGQFGPNSKKLTVAWQRSRGLLSDGIVGPKTWEKAESENNPIAAAAQKATELINQAAAPITGGAPIIKPPSAPTQKPTLRAGIHKTNPATIPYVKQWQSVVGAKADGIFGPDTTARTISYQKSRKLKADGIVGPQTWAAADANTPPLVQAAQQASVIVQQAAAATAAAASKPPVPSQTSPGQPTGTKPPTVPGTKPPAATSTPAQAVTAAVSTATETVTALPLWARILGGVAILFGVGAGVRSIMKKPKKRPAQLAA